MNAIQLASRATSRMTDPMRAPNIPPMAAAVLPDHSMLAAAAATSIVPERARRRFARHETISSTARTA